jgi:hypothetical protein
VQYWLPSYDINRVIERGIKETNGIPEYLQSGIEDTIMNGIKETLPQPFHTDDIIEDILESGVKETKPMDEWVNSGRIIDLFIDGSVKETKPLPSQDGNKDWSEYSRGREDRTKPHTEYVDDAIKLGDKL